MDLWSTLLGALILLVGVIVGYGLGTPERKKDKNG